MPKPIPEMIQTWSDRGSLRINYNLLIPNGFGDGVNKVYLVPEDEEKAFRAKRPPASEIPIIVGLNAPLLIHDSDCPPARGSADTDQYSIVDASQWQIFRLGMLKFLIVYKP
jgi:hypothetical protein